MQSKRKYNVPGSVESHHGQLDGSSSSTSPPHIGQSNPVEHYPRKRIAIACNVCRFRKTRCDAAKPSCGFCTDLGIECTYRKPTVGDRAKLADPPREDLVTIERRLSQLEARLSSIDQSSPNSLTLPSNVLTNTKTLRPDLSSRTSSLDREISTINSPNTSSPTIETPRYDFAYRQTATEALSSRPSLLTFRAPSYIHVESWDYTAEFYDDEIIAGETLADHIELLHSRPLDLSKRTTRRLQQSFVENFLRWTPIFDQNVCIGCVDEAAAGNFVLPNPSTCLTMFLFALGQISEERIEDSEPQMPGLDYFAQGCQILERLSFRTGSVTTLQCRILQASYFKFAIRPLQSWNSITQAARDCMHLLSSRMLERMDAFEQESFHRAFWACSTILHELEATMKMHPTGLRHFHDIVPLPRFDEEDSGFYYFLAQISLRKFLTQSMEVVGYQSGRVVYAPVVTKELRKQIREWYEHLPSAVRFPVDATPVFDSRKSFLRGQYIALFVVLGWPSVLKIMEHGMGRDSAQISSDTLATAREQAQGCIEGCCLFLSVADEQLTGRKMGTHFTLWAAYATLATLIITFDCPALAFIEETKQEHHIQNAYEILRPWEHLPLMRRGLERIRNLMRQAGLAGLSSASSELVSRGVSTSLPPGLG